MGINRTRRTAVVATAFVLVAFAVPAFSASSPGSIKLTAPIAYSSHGKDLAIEWVWKTGTYVKSGSKVDVFITNNGLSWSKLAAAVPIRSGGVDWSTMRLPDGAYAFRVTVTGTSLRSTASPIYIDNTAPRVDIVRPSSGQVIVEDTTPAFAVVAGKATLVADATDAFSGVQEVKWMLNDVVIGSGASFEYNFSAHPGQHVLTAVAFDKAGNTADDRINIVALPGPSGAGAVPSPPSAPEIPSTPTPPTAPGTPDPGQAPGTPDVEPSEAPQPPDPIQLIPTAVPTP